MSIICLYWYGSGKRLIAVNHCRDRQTRAHTHTHTHTHASHTHASHKLRTPATHQLCYHASEFLLTSSAVGILRGFACTPHHPRHRHPLVSALRALVPYPTPRLPLCPLPPSLPSCHSSSAAQNAASDWPIWTCWKRTAAQALSPSEQGGSPGGSGVPECRLAGGSGLTAARH